MDISLLRNNPLFEGFSDKELYALSKLIKRSYYLKNQPIIHKNDLSDDLYIIESGEVEVVEKENKSPPFVLCTMKKGEVFGELSFVDQEPRSADIIATNDSYLWVISRDLMTSDKGRIPLLKKLLKNLMIISLSRLRELNTQYAKNLEENLKRLNQQKQSGIYAIRVFCVISLILILDYTLKSIGLNVKEDFTSLLSILIVGLLTIYFYKKEHISFEESGLTFKHWPRALTEGTLIGLVLGLSAFGLFGLFEDFQFRQVIQEFLQRFEFSKWLFIYVFHSFIQEFIVRIGFQFSVEKFLNDKRGHLSIFITSLIFASMHTHWNWEFVASIFFGNMIFGYIYLKRRSIVEMTAIHYFSGIVVYFLGETK